MFLGAISKALNLGSHAYNAIKSVFPSTQDANNAYSRAEMQYANELENNRAREANRVAQENATIAFERTKQLQDEAMAFNAEEAQKARDYDTLMSNTAYQRAMKDLKSAGLNPILAYSQGGAPVTGGQSASIGATSASQAQAYSAGVQRQDIDKSSTTELKKTRMTVLGNIYSAYINNASRVASSMIYKM